MHRRLVRILLVVALGAALATTALASPAVAQGPTLTVSLTGTATLVAKGALVDVDVVYSCGADTTSATIRVDLTQRVGGGHLARGAGFVRFPADLVCDGAEHAATVPVLAEGDLAFKHGDAVGVVNFVVCIPFNCFFGQLPPSTVRIH